MKKLSRKLAWLLRTLFGTIWLISGLLFAANGAAGLAESDADIANTFLIRAGWFGAIMLVGMLSHAYLIHEHTKQFPPEDDGNYPNWDIE